MARRGVGSVVLVVLLLFGAAVAFSKQRVQIIHSDAVGVGGIAPLTLITEPDQGITPIISLISSASSSVDIVMYEFEDPQIEQVLSQDTARGVEVRVILNGGYYGKKEDPDNDAAYAYLRQHGVQVHWSSTSFALTHQKTIVIDSREAAIMTLNFTPQYYPTSRDFAVIDSAPNDVSAIERTFNADWNDELTAPQNGDDLVWSPGSEQSLLSIIDSAQTSLDIYNEEMDDPTITAALVAAAKRGVAVRVDMTYSSEWRKAFTQLANAGTQVRIYAANASLYIHAKVIVADDSKAFIGSENFSSGSLQYNRELGIITSDTSIVASLEQTFQKDWVLATPFEARS